MGRSRLRRGGFGQTVGDDEVEEAWCVVRIEDKRWCGAEKLAETRMTVFRGLISGITGQKVAGDRAGAVGGDGTQPERWGEEYGAL